MKKGEVKETRNDGKERGRKKKENWGLEDVGERWKGGGKRRERRGGRRGGEPVFEERGEIEKEGTEEAGKR